MNTELDLEINRLLHIIANVTDDINREKKNFDAVIINSTKKLLIARTDVLRIVEIVNREE